jgi:hypothetical protein
MSAQSTGHQPKLEHDIRTRRIDRLPTDRRLIVWTGYEHRPATSNEHRLQGLESEITGREDVLPRNTFKLRIT